MVRISFVSCALILVILELTAVNGFPTFTASDEARRFNDVTSDEARHVTSDEATPRISDEARHVTSDEADVLGDELHSDEDRSNVDGCDCENTSVCYQSGCFLSCDRCH